MPHNDDQDARDRPARAGRRDPKTGQPMPPGIAARPFSIRLTEEERGVLEARAGCIPLSTFIRDLLLGEGLAGKRRRVAAPVKDHAALARVLALLGRSRVASNLNQLAKAANLGVLPASPMTEAELRAACAAVAEMRAQLMRALGLGGGGAP